MKTLQPVCPACGSLECLCRPRFFAGQLLTEEDLNRLDHYIVEKNKLHNRYLHVQGNLRVTNIARKPGGGSWTVLSDARLKTKVGQLKGVLDKLLQLRGVHFEWRDPQEMGNLTGVQTGLIAQEVEKVFPEWVTPDSEGYKELTIRGFEALVIEALRELKNEVDQTKKRLDKISAGAARRQRAKNESTEKSSCSRPKCRWAKM